MNPVTPVPVFEHRFQGLHDFIMGRHALLELWSLLRRLSSKREVPHIYMYSTGWKMPPQLDVDPDDVICKFTDQYITAHIWWWFQFESAGWNCAAPHLFNYCWRKNRTCSFWFQKIPSSQTVIAHHLAEEFPCREERITIAKEVSAELKYEIVGGLGGVHVHPPPEIKLPWYSLVAMGL